MHDWEENYGSRDVPKIQFKIAQGFYHIHSLLQERKLSQDGAQQELCNQIGNKEFAASPLGKFVLISILKGHTVNSKNFFKGTGVVYDERFPVTILNAHASLEQEHTGLSLVHLVFLYHDIKFSVMKSISEVFAMLY